ncbi:MAG: Hsp20 family protein [Acidimicrobiales bacterium]
MLLRFDPFRDLDRLADEAFRAPNAMPMDAVRKGDQVVVALDLPGVDPSSIDVEVERNVLTVAAERRWARSEDEQVLAAERRHGSLRRQLVLGDNLDGSRIDAAYQDGVLVLSIPVAETAKPRKVAVAAGNGAPAIEAEATEAAAG